MKSSFKRMALYGLSSAFVIGMSAMDTVAQFGRYPNTGGRGFSNSYGSQFGNSSLRGGSVSGRQFSGGSVGSGFGGYGGGIGGSSIGGGGFSSRGRRGASLRGGSIGAQQFGTGGGFGSSRGRSSRGSRGGRFGGRSDQGFNSGFDSGGGFSSRGRSSRGRDYRRYGGDQQSNVQGLSPTSQGGGDPQQTAPSGSNTDRRAALRGSSSRGALSPSGGGSGDTEGMIEIQGGTGGGGRTSRPQGGGGQGGRPSKPKQPSVKIKPVATFFLNTPNLVQVVDEPFPVDIKLSNPIDSKFDTLKFAIDYDPEVLMPIRFLPPEKEGDPVDWEPLGKVTLNDTYAQALGNDPQPANNNNLSKTNNEPTDASFIAANSSRYEITENTVDETQGIMRFSANALSESRNDGGTVARVYFVPLKPANSINLSFINADPTNPGQETLTALTLNGSDKLGSQYNPNDGTAGLSLKIYESLDQAKRDPRVMTDNESKFAQETTSDNFGTHIYVLPREKQVDVGDLVEVDFYLANPNNETLDTLNVLMAYNPRVFEPVDTDDVEPGVNLLDEDYQNTFNFDFPIMNAVKPENGLVDYRIQGFKVPVRGEGVFATLRLRAVRPTTKTTFRLFLSDTGEPPTTGVFYRNQDRLGDPSDPYDGVSTSSVSVRPTMAYLEQMRLRQGEG